MTTDGARHGHADGTLGDVVDLDLARSRRDTDSSAPLEGEVLPRQADVSTRQDEDQVTSYEVALDDEPEGVPTFAPVPGGPAVMVQSETRMPIIPPVLRSTENFKAAAKHELGRVGHRIAYHAVRVPMYTLVGSYYAGKGVVVVADRQFRWWWLTEATALRRAAKDVGHADVWHRMHHEIKETRKRRGLMLAGELVGIASGAAALVLATPLWVPAAVTVTVGALLARIGRGSGKQIVNPAVLTPRYRKLSYDVVLRAYQVAGLHSPDKKEAQISFPPPGMSRDGAGSRVVVDLAFGKGFSDVIKAREAIASGLDVKVSQVFVTPDPTSNRRHTLWVADQDPLAMHAGRTSLLNLKRTDIWKPVPVGLDERGHKVSLLLMWISVLVGAQPRKGKTFFARLLALYAALDPHVKILLADGKNSPDWDKFRLIAHRAVFGTVPNTRDNDPVTHLIDMLQEVKKHIEEVNDFLSKLPVTECPEGKITPELSRKHPELRVWLLVMEEFQTYFELDDQDTNKRVASLLSFIMAVGPSAGVILISASQKPSGVGAGDVSRLFNRYRDNHTVRFALKCGNRTVSEAVLGSDAYSEGFDASSLPIGKAYLGVGILYGASDDTPTVRTYLADHGDAEKILIAARKLRQDAGTLTGQAAGEDLNRETRDALADAASVYLVGETFLSWQTLAARLAEQLPEHYADTTQNAISSQLTELKVPSRNGRDKTIADPKARLRGAYLADIGAAVERRAAGNQ